MTRVQLEGDAVVASEPWRSDDAVNDSFAAPVSAGGTRDQVAIAFDAYVVIVPETGSPQTIELPEVLGDPCLTASGMLVAVGVDVDPDAPVSDEVTPNQDPVDRPVYVEEHTEQGWAAVDGDSPSWAQMYMAGSEFWCVPSGLAYGPAGQKASWAWDGEWHPLDGGAVEDLKSSRESSDGQIVGVRGGEVVSVDRVSGEEKLHVPLPTDLALRIESGELDRLERLVDGESDTGLGSIEDLESIVNTLWLNVGGQGDSLRAVHCESPVELKEEIDCVVF